MPLRPGCATIVLLIRGQCVGGSVACDDGDKFLRCATVRTGENGLEGEVRPVLQFGLGTCLAPDRVGLASRVDAGFCDAGACGLLLPMAVVGWVLTRFGCAK